MISRVAQIVSAGKVAFFSREVAQPKPGEVVIHIKASAICGSDLHTFKAAHPSVPLPATIGHEFSGDIIALGGGVSGLTIGQRVTAEPCEACGTCEACLQGEYSSCERLCFIYRRGDGAMADYITVKAGSVYPLAENMTYEEGALVEPTAVAVHAVRRAEVTLGDCVLVMGAGPIGLLTAALSRRMGAREVIVADMDAFRLQTALTLGATRTVNLAAGESLEDVVQAATGGQGVEKSFECVGREQAFLQAITHLRRKGLAIVVGIYEQGSVTIPMMRIVQRELRIQGAQGYCWDFPIAMRMVTEMGAGRLVTHRFGLDSLQTALETAMGRSANAIKVLVRP